MGPLAFILAGLAAWGTVCALGYGKWSIPPLAAIGVASLIEFLPSPVYDNLFIPLGAGAVMFLLVSAGYRNSET